MSLILPGLKEPEMTMLPMPVIIDIYLRVLEINRRMCHSCEPVRVDRPSRDGVEAILLQENALAMGQMEGSARLPRHSPYPPSRRSHPDISQSSAQHCLVRIAIQLMRLRGEQPQPPWAAGYLGSWGISLVPYLPFEISTAGLHKRGEGEVVCLGGVSVDEGGQLNPILYCTLLGARGTRPPPRWFLFLCDHHVSQSPRIACACRHAITVLQPIRMQGTTHPPVCSTPRSIPSKSRPVYVRIPSCDLWNEGSDLICPSSIYQLTII
ncbi:hypothetical protein BJV78DRAFT_849932 [Lactifluus subvellereus]|nr:hypothetical protein BJV78DRAFT_849932 [Lactifluus subvellereus]